MQMFKCNVTGEIAEEWKRDEVSFTHGCVCIDCYRQRDFFYPTLTTSKNLPFSGCSLAHNVVCVSVYTSAEHTVFLFRCSQSDCKVLALTRIKCNRSWRMPDDNINEVLRQFYTF